jgi:predicted PurR-regulated permease PerM
MTEIVQPALGDRRRTERRTNQNLAELTLPEFRRMLVTTTLFVIVLVLFLYMVRTVIIATILGVVVAVYLRPAYLRLYKGIPNKTLAATLTLLLLIVPIIALLVYSYLEIADVAAYVDAHRQEIASKIDAARASPPVPRARQHG